jgi:hypothetical protein
MRGKRAPRPDPDPYANRFDPPHAGAFAKAIVDELESRGYLARKAAEEAAEEAHQRQDGVEDEAKVDYRDHAEKPSASLGT